MLPPSPPSPPSGPPYGTNFSRRKLTQPAPPSPPLTNTSISSTNMPYTRAPGGAVWRPPAPVGAAPVTQVTSPSNPQTASHFAEHGSAGPPPLLPPGSDPRPPRRTE